ncbi:hypothetical protein ACFLU5_13945 [Bacteroidota bacterium]
MRINEKDAFGTGTSRVIGLAIANKLTDNGARVAGWRSITPINHLTF